MRHPASFCGTVGLKPSYGLCSRFGLIAMTSSTDVPGTLTKSVEDAAMILTEIAGNDPQDSTTATSKIPDYAQIKKVNWKNLKIGIPKELKNVSVAPVVKKSLDRIVNEIKKQGGKIVEISLPSNEYALAAYYIITPSEVSSNLARYDGIRFGDKGRENGFGPEVKRRIMLGTYCLSSGYYDAYYIRAQKVRTKIIADFNKAFERCDLIMTPTTPTTAFKLGAKTSDPLKMYLEDSFGVPASLAGLPAISIPASKKPLPIGVQLIAPIFQDAKLLAAAQALESLTVDRTQRPNI